MRQECEREDSVSTPQVHKLLKEFSETLINKLC